MDDLLDLIVIVKNQLREHENSWEAKSNSGFIGSSQVQQYESVKTQLNIRLEQLKSQLKVLIQGQQ